MSYKARRKEEVQTRTEKTTHLMSEPPPIERLSPGDVIPQRVALRFDARTVRHIRVSKLERNLDYYADLLAMTVSELQRLIALRRYTPAPEPAPEAVDPRAPSWYVSDQYCVLSPDFF